MANLQKLIAEFKKQTGYTLELNDGHLCYGGNLYLRGTGITSLPDNLTVGGNLDLRGTGITSLPDNLTVGGYLDLEGCTGITSLPDNLTVGGNLYLRGTGITSLPDNLTVGGNLYLRGTGITDTSKVKKELSPDARKRIATVKQATNLLQWDWNGKRYIKIDGMFTVLDSHKGNVYLVHQIGKTDQMYIVTDGEGHYAHGNTMQEAKADLIYKINDRDTSAYKHLTLDDELTFEEAIAAYRTITGACYAGTRNYIENRLPKPHKEKYTIREILQLTKGEYKSETFKNFFCNGNH